MTNVTIVAIPESDDKVWQISSEKVPHLTLVYMEGLSDEEVATVAQYTRHAASELSPFYYGVDHRDTLGDKEADVLFFEDNYSERIKSFRHHLLLNDTVRKGYDAAPQFETWTPHLTLGYPDAPAKEDTSDYRKIHGVHFDRVAVWVDDYDGPEFRLKYEDLMVSDSVAWGESTVNALFHDEELKHYGVPGMRWGFRKDGSPGSSRKAKDRTPTDPVVTQAKPGTYAKTSGGANQPISKDAAASLEARQKAKKSTTDALSNAELRAAVDRMRLEQQYNQLRRSEDRQSSGAKFARGFFGVKKKDINLDPVERNGKDVRDAVDTILDRKKQTTS